MLRLIRSYLTAGVLEHGLFERVGKARRKVGRSRHCSRHLVLDELDRELERRGHRFVRYADDCNIYVRSEHAGRRVMARVTRFIERRLKLQVNATKSAVARPWDRSFLGFSVRREYGLRRCIAPKALARCKHRVRLITGRHRGVSLEQLLRDLSRYLRGWAGYFGFSQLLELRTLDSWIRRRVRCIACVQWKTWRRRLIELRRRGVPMDWIRRIVSSAKGPWRLSTTRPLTRAFSDARLQRLGLISMASVVTT